MIPSPEFFSNKIEYFDNMDRIINGTGQRFFNIL